MEVVGAIASSLQIVAQCGQITMTIIKWVEAVRTVDERINQFVTEVTNLRATYESLQISLQSPSMVDAAAVTNRDVGGHLWDQLSRTLRDCEKTMILITNILRKIQMNSNHFRPVLKQLKESLHSGELSRLREQVVMFNSSLQLPMQMITLTLQLRQQEMTTAHQFQLNEQLAGLRRGIQRVERLSQGLKPPRREVSISGSTLVGDSTADKLWFDNMESYVETAKKFLDNASVAASTLSAASIKNQDEDLPAIDYGRRGSSFVPLTQQQYRNISMYVEDLPVDNIIDTPLTSDAQSTTEPVFEDSDDDDTDLMLLQALLANGQAAADKHDFAGAEDNYREALSVSQGTNFGDQVACSTPDIALMLGECLARQDKFDEAIALLEPLAKQASARMETPQSSAASGYSQSRNAEKGQALAASHLLGEVYVKKSDLINAETHAVQAFKGRKKLLGENHPKTIDSVHLVIDMYKAKGQTARAEAHRVFLKPVLPVQEVRQPSISPSLSNTSSPTPAEPMSVPIDASLAKQRRPTFNFKSPFRKSDRIDAPTSIPMNRNPSGGTPYLSTGEVDVLSTSPHDTSSLHTTSDTKMSRPIRTDSVVSSESQVLVQRSSTGGDQYDEPQLDFHKRTRSSLTHVPTIYASLSKADMSQIFQEMATLCSNGKSSKAADKGIQFMKKYDPGSTLLILREAELRENIKKSKTRGLSGTGYGFSPLHFFCSLNYEPLTEIEILLQMGADVQAVAYKAGFGKRDPFTPLTAAIDKGHHNLVQLLLCHGARYSADRETLHPLLRACSDGKATIVESLLELGKMNVLEEQFPRSWHGNSLLHEACYRCDLKMVECLISFARRTNTLNELRYSFVGTPGQQDQFGMTPIMHAIDVRDSSDPKLRPHKLRARIDCLKLMLFDDSDVQVTVEQDQVLVDHSHPRGQGRLATDLHVQDKRGNTVYWYAEDAQGGNAELRAFLDEQFRRSRLIEF